MSTEDGRPREVVPDVPQLDGPPFGWGCCAVTRVDILLEELDSRPGLLALDVDPERGVAAVLVTPGHQADLTAVSEGARGPWAPCRRDLRHGGWAIVSG